MFKNKHLNILLALQGLLMAYIYGSHLFIEEMSVSRLIWFTAFFISSIILYYMIDKERKPEQS